MCRFTEIVESNLTLSNPNSKKAYIPIPSHSRPSHHSIILSSHPHHPITYHPQVNAESGAVTLMSTIIAAVLVIIALLFFTGAFYYIPMCAFAAVINVSMLSMMDFHQIVNAYRLARSTNDIILRQYNAVYANEQPPYFSPSRFLLFLFFVLFLFHSLRSCAFLNLIS